MAKECKQNKLVDDSQITINADESVDMILHCDHGILTPKATDLCRKLADNVKVKSGCDQMRKECRKKGAVGSSAAGLNAPTAMLSFFAVFVVGLLLQ